MSPFGTSNSGRIAGLRLVAPPTGRLVAIDYQRRMLSIDTSWEVRLSADSQTLESCVVTFIDEQCPDATQTGRYATTLPGATQQLDLAAWCVGGGCPYGSGPVHSVAFALYSSTVTVEESGLPSVSAPAFTGLGSDGWASSGASVTFAGSDQLGLRKIELVEGGVVRSVKNGVCVDWSVRPCAEASAGVGLSSTVPVSSLGLAAGTHTLRTRATDGAGNESLSAPVTVKIDTEAPVAFGLAGGGTSGVPMRTLTWNVPSGGSPVVSAKVELCSFSGTRCESFAAPAGGPFTFDATSWVDVNASVTLTDAAGNSALTERPHRFIYDGVAPRAPWVDVLPAPGQLPERKFRLQKIDYDTVIYRLLLCSVTTGACTELPSVSAEGGDTADIALTVPAEGPWRLETTAVDGSGNVSTPTASLFGWYTSKVPPDGPGGPGGNNPKKIVVLSTKFPSKLGKGSVLVRGSINAGSTTAITAVLTGKRSSGKAFRVTKTVKPNAKGAWALRAKLPARIKRRSGVLVTVTATPAAGWTGAKAVRKRLR